MSPSVPPLARSADERALATTVARMIDDTAPISRVRECYGTERPASPESWKALAAAGVAGALVDEASGGLGLRLADLAGVLEATGRAVYGGPVISTVAATAAVRDGELLRDIAAGSVVAVLLPGAPEPGGGRVTRVWEWVLDAPIADLLLVPADGGLLAVAAESAVVTWSSTVDGSRTVGRVELRDAPGSLILGDPAAGQAASTVAMCADGYGAAAAAFELAVAHALTREQFGVPIGSFQAVQHLLVDAFTTLRLGGLAIREALDDPGPRQVATALAACADGFVDVAATAIQVLGGLGYTWESDAQLYYKRLLWLQTAFGGRDQALDALAALTIDSSA